MLKNKQDMPHIVYIGKKRKILFGKFKKIYKRVTI